MGAFSDYIDSLKSSLAGTVPYGGTIVPTSDEFPIAIANHIKGGYFPVPTLEVLADIPYQILSLGMSVAVMEHERTDGSIHPRSVYYLRQLPPENTRVNEVSGYVIANYWSVESLGNVNDQADIEVQYAPNFDGKRPKFLLSDISYDAYQEGYPTEAAYIGGNPSDIIWVDEFDPLLNHVWIRQRLGSQSWGIPISLSAAGDYEQNQYLDVIFLWVTKGNPAPSRPSQPDNYKDLPMGWLNTPGPDYATRILTEDLYRSQAIKNPYGVLKSNWDIPLLVSSDPNIVRYGNTPGSTDFLNDIYWRGYYTPGLDTYMATRPDGVSTEWTISKIDQEDGEFTDFVFMALSLAATSGDIIAATPTLPVPIGGAFPNNCQDGPFEVGVNEVLYMSKAVKYADGSLKTPWTLPKRFDGIDVIQAVLSTTPGDTFYQYRNTSGDLAFAFPAITIAAELYKGMTLLSGISAYNWYRGSTLITFDSGTRKANNLGVLLNPYHEVSVDGASLIINPEGIDVSQQYKVGITHESRPGTDYEAQVQLKDATDDGAAFVASIKAVNGTTFKNQVGLYRFDANFFKGGLLDGTSVVFTWSITDLAGAAISSALRDSGGISIGDTDVAAASVYVLGADIADAAVLILTATFGEVVRQAHITLTDIQDAEAVEALYWGSGTVDPGNPTDFTPRELTKAEVLALSIGYSEDATGKWYMIQRIGGVWGGEIQLRAESARPNGGINQLIYKNIEIGVDPVPTAPAVPGSGSIVPAGWTATPTAFTGSQDATYMTSALFILRIDVNADPATLTRDNYYPSGGYGTPVRITGIDGTNTDPGINGDNGWSPYITVVADGNRRVLFLADWIGGTGTKPAGAGGSNSYIGSSGLTTIALATDFRGPAGVATNPRPQHIVQAGSENKTITASTSVSTGVPKYLQKAVVTNSLSEPRWYLVLADVAVKEDDNSDIMLAMLTKNLGANPLVYINPYYPFVETTVVDANKQRIDVENTAPAYSHKLKLQHLQLIGAGETYQFQLWIQETDGGAGRHNGGTIEVMGL